MWISLKNNSKKLLEKNLHITRTELYIGFKIWLKNTANSQNCRFLGTIQQRKSTIICHRLRNSMSEFMWIILRPFIIFWVFDWLQSIASGINGKFWRSQKILKSLIILLAIDCVFSGLALCNFWGWIVTILEQSYFCSV